MASKKRSAIDQFAELLLPPLPDAIKDISNNDHYAPKEDMVDNWTVLVEKNDKDIFVLRFAYQIKADLEEQEKWMKLKLWTVECAVAQGDYVVIDLEKNDDRVTFILHEHMHPFSNTFAQGRVLHVRRGAHQRGRLGWRSRLGASHAVVVLLPMRGQRVVAFHMPLSFAALVVDQPGKVFPLAPVHMRGG